MDPNDQPPDESSPRTLTIRLTRDTLILLAAMVFLAIAILLAVLFPSGGGEPGEVAQATPPATRTAAVAQATAIVVPAATQPPPGLTPSPVEVAPTQAYPPPGEAPAGGAPSPTPDQLRPTPAPGTEGAPTVAAAGLPTAYPPPGAGAAVTSTPAKLAGSPTPPTAAGQAPTVVAPTVVAPTAAAPTLVAPTVARPTPVAPAAPVPTSPPVQAASSGPPSTRPPPRPTAPPVDVVRGTSYWTAARSPVVVGRDLQIPPGAALIVEPGVEVRLAPGVSIVVDGQLLALGQPGRPVRFVGADQGRWEGIFGRAGGAIVLEHAEIRGGGAGGTLIASEGGALALRASRVTDNGGHIRAAGSSVEVRDTEIAGNDMPYGAALDLTYTAGGSVTLAGNRIGGNRMAAGLPPVQLTSQSPADAVNLDIQRNLLVGQDGPNLTLITNGPLQGSIICNTLVGGANGLSIRGTLPQVPGLPLLRVRDNAIEKHTPPILPIYLEFGIGRGATSEVALDMRQNWWESESGPYEPDRHADGRGEAVGEWIEFQPWLTARPACAPVQ